MSDPDLLSDGEDAHLLHFAQTAFFGDAPAKVGVAVSGGSDSMAVLHLFARAAAQAGFTVHAVTVDHGLRPEAADEARFVAEACSALGVSHDVLRWEHGEITGNLQDQARRARYELIAAWAGGQGIGHVALGHTVDDQAETFLMGLAREAGVDGLSGMRHSFRMGGVRFDRPFLSHSRADLRAYLTRNGIGWIEDPSNDDEVFERVKARKALARLKPLGITAKKLGGVAHNLSMVRQALGHHCAEVARRITIRSKGDVVFDRRSYMTQTPEVKRRLLSGALQWVSGADYPPRGRKVSALAHAIVGRKDSTLGGCRILASDTQFRILREARAVRDVVCASDQVWDGRWQLIGPHAPDLEIRALGADGLRACPDWRGTGIPRASLLASPSVWRGDALISAPFADYPSGWRAELVESRDDFIESLISH